jgi:hypothetical protein
MAAGLRCFRYGHGHIRAHNAAGCTIDAVFRPGLIGWKIALGIHLAGYLEYFFGAYGHA